MPVAICISRGVPGFAPKKAQVNGPHMPEQWMLVISPAVNAANGVLITSCIVAFSGGA